MVQLNPFNNKIPQQQAPVGVQKPQGAAKQQGAGAAGAGPNFNALFSGKLGGKNAAQKPPGLQGAEQGQVQSPGQQFSLTQPRPAEGVGARLSVVG